MILRRFHYDQAFEYYLRAQKVTYMAVDEAKRALGGTHPYESLKNFDLVIYSKSGLNLLVDVKGRKHTGSTNRSLDNWVTKADVECLEQWEMLFGAGYEGAFAFLYWCQQQPPDALFQEIFECGGRWYAVLVIKLADYRQHMRQRSPRWGTVSMPAKIFAQRAVTLKSLL